jgi:hypothetical protein
MLIFLDVSEGYPHRCHKRIFDQVSVLNSWFANVNQLNQSTWKDGSSWTERFWMMPFSKLA